MDFNSFFSALSRMGGSDDGASYEEIRKLDHLLLQAGIPHKFLNHMVGGFQIVYYGKKGPPPAEPGVIQGPGVGAVCSVIETPFSYGHENDRLEIGGLLTEEEYQHDSVAGDLTAEDVFRRISDHWAKENQT